MNPNPNLNPNTDHDHDDEHDRGLAYDLTRFNVSVMTPINRLGGSILDRRVDRRDFVRFGLLASVAGAATIGGFRRSASAQTNTTSAAACADIPEETAGPYPGDGTNGPNVLTASGVVRRDIRSSFGSMTGTAPGVPLTVTLKLTDSAACAPAKGYAVYLWHADQQGRYSLYSAGVTDQNFLRGVQEADAEGNVTFQTIFPGCYDGRWPHIHFEVYPNLAAAGDASKRIATSQLAFPKATCEQAYATTGYSASVSNLSRVSLASDGVFGDDGGARQVASMSGTAAAGFVAVLPVSVSNTVKASAGMGAGPGGGAGGQRPQNQTQTPTTTPATTPTTLAKKITTTVKKTATTKKKGTSKTVTTTKRTSK